MQVSMAVCQSVTAVFAECMWYLRRSKTFRCATSYHVLGSFNQRGVPNFAQRFLPLIDVGAASASYVKERLRLREGRCSC